MKLLLWPLLACTSVLLLCEVVVSWMSSSTILLMDSFHTFFLLMTISFAVAANSQDPRVPAPTARPAATSESEESPRGSHEVDEGSVANEPSSSLPNDETDETSSLDSGQVHSPVVSAPVYGCGVCFCQGRMEAVGEFISRLSLSCLTVSYSLNMISMSIESRPVQNGVWLVALGVVSLIFKAVVLGLCWDKLREKWAPPPPRSTRETSCLEDNPEVSAAQGFSEPGQGSKDHRSELDKSSHNGALVFCNPEALRPPESETQTQTPGRQGTGDDRLPEGTDAPQFLSDGTTSIANNSVENPANNPGGSESRTGRPFWWPSFLTVCEVLLAPLLAAINGAVQLHLGCQQPDLTWKIDLGFSVLALVVLNAITMPQLYKFGRLLLQATPPHVNVSDLDHKISGIPGVLAVHELHIWELTPSFTVAAVHVQFHAWVPVDKCADLILEVTKVLQVGGVGCYTIQPEFDTRPEKAAALPPLPHPACALACGKNCTKYMCCGSLEDQTSSNTAPSSGGTGERPPGVIVKMNECCY